MVLSRKSQKRGRALTEKANQGAEGELAHARSPGPASLRKAGDVTFSDEPVGGAFRLQRPTPPAVPCSCSVCLLAAVKSPSAERGQRSACESMRLKRSHNLLGLRHLAPGDGYTLRELARYLGKDVVVIRELAKRMGLLRRLAGDRRFAALTRDQAKKLIGKVRSYPP